ncbi:hypothetical protein ACJ41O_005110 [Fusarium nematophilum]
MVGPLLHSACWDTPFQHLSAHIRLGSRRCIQLCRRHHQGGCLRASSIAGGRPLHWPTQLGSNLANAASLLWHAYKSLGSPSKDVNWAGFYVLDKSSQDPQLILGPFQGKVACQTIRVGKGVCGAAAESLETQLVEDVETFPGHIACDGDSKSEIVVPIVADQDDGSKKLVAIIDIDCAELNGFDGVDKLHLEQLAVLLAKSCDW